MTCPWRATVGALLLGVLSLSTAGCAAWHTEPVATLRNSHGVRDQLQLWVHGRAYALHGVRPVNDSVYGIPLHQPPACDSCALHFAVKDVDSVRTLKAGETVGRNLLWAVPLALAVAFVWGLTHMVFLQ